LKALIALLAVVCLLALACGSGDDKGIPIPPASSDGLPVLRLTSADSRTKASLSYELADEPDELEKGLSKRESLAADSGMLFVLGQQSGGGFWMKDTSIPLTVAFIDACGVIVAVADMQPLSLQVHGTDKPYYYGLEVNQGWLAQHGLGVQSTVELPADLRAVSCKT
jgi:uncharacterized membrane protein (UPF0127 family)